MYLVCTLFVIFQNIVNVKTSSGLDQLKDNPLSNYTSIVVIIFRGKQQPHMDGGLIPSLLYWSGGQSRVKKLSKNVPKQTRLD